MRTRHLAFFGLIIILLFPVFISEVGAAESNFTITVEDSLETPPRTVSQSGIEYEIDAIARVDTGDMLSVTVGAPTEASYRLYLQNADQQIIDSRQGTGPDSFTLELENLPAGSYLLSISHDGIRQTIHPVVVRAFTIDAEIPPRIREHTPVPIEVSVTRVSDEKSIHQSELVIANNEQSTRTTFDLSMDGYTGTVSTPNLPPGEYTAYVVLRGNQEFFGSNEILGVSDPRPLEITSSNTTPPRTATNAPTTQTTSPPPNIITPQEPSPDDDSMFSVPLPGFTMSTTLTSFLAILVLVITRSRS